MIQRTLLRPCFSFLSILSLHSARFALNLSIVPVKLQRLRQLWKREKRLSKSTRMLLLRVTSWQSLQSRSPKRNETWSGWTWATFLQSARQSWHVLCTRSSRQSKMVSVSDCLCVIFQSTSCSNQIMKMPAKLFNKKLKVSKLLLLAKWVSIKLTLTLLQPGTLKFHFQKQKIRSWHLLFL